VAAWSSSGAQPDLTARIADQIARLRESQGLSMSDFAREVGLSARQLADVERGRKPVPIDLLLRACRRFRKPIEYFLSRASVERPYYWLHRAADIARLPLRKRRGPAGDAALGGEFRSLAGGFEARGLFPYYVRLRQAPRGDVALHEHHGQEFAYVVSGEVTLVTIVGGQRVTETMTAGDTCFIDSTVPHRFIGHGASPYGESSAEIIDVYWCPLGESYLFEED
jgi:transcriptional regulator with XRE-family HTH domain